MNGWTSEQTAATSGTAATVDDADQAKLTRPNTNENSISNDAAQSGAGAGATVVAVDVVPSAAEPEPRPLSHLIDLATC